MTIFEHMEAIDEVMSQRLEAESAALMQMVGGGSGIGLGFASGGIAGPPLAPWQVPTSGSWGAHKTMDPHGDWDDDGIPNNMDNI